MNVSLYTSDEISLLFRICGRPLAYRGRQSRVSNSCEMFRTRTLRSQNTRILWASIFNDRGIWMGFKSNSMDGKLIFPFLIFSNRNTKVSKYFFFFFFYKSWNLSKLFIYVLVDSIYFTKYYTYLLNFRIIAKLFKNKIEKMVKN